MILRLQQYVIRRLKDDRLIGSVARVVGGTAVGQVLAVAVSPILTRLYSPDDFGVLGVYTSILTIVMVVSALSYEQAIPIPEDDETAANLLVLALGLCGLATAVLAGGLEIFYGPVSTSKYLGPLAPYIWLLPVGLIGSSSNQVLRQWTVRKRDYKVLARTGVTQGIGQVLTQLGLGFVVPGPIGLLVGQAVGQSSGSGNFAKALWRGDRQKLRTVTWSGITGVARRYIRFPTITSPAVLLNSVGGQLPVLLLAFYYGPATAGFYTLAQRVVGVPVNLIVTSVSQVYVGEVAVIAKRQPSQLPALFLDIARKLTAVGIVVIGSIGLAAPLLFRLVFGPNWVTAGLYLRLLTPMFLVQVVSAPFGGTVSVLERQDLHLLREVARIVLMTGAVVFAGITHQPEVTALAIVATAGSAGYAIYCFVSWWAIKSMVAA